MLDKLDVLFDEFGWDKSAYSFLRGEKDMSPYSVIKKGENETILVHNIVGIAKKDLNITLKTENGQRILYIDGATTDPIKGKQYKVDSRFVIKTANRIKEITSETSNGLLYIRVKYEVEPETKIEIK